MGELKLETFLWRGQTRFRCPDCAWDGPSEGAAVKHWTESHCEQASPVPTLFDAHDRLIEPDAEIVTSVSILNELGLNDGE